MKKIDYILAGIAAASCAIFWIISSLSTGKALPGSLYYVVWIGGFGGVLFYYRKKIEAKLRGWKAPALAKFLLLGYGAVLLEEIFAALANNFSEGFSFPLYILRIGQFWAFNILAFTGFIIGWYLLYKHINFSKREVFYLAGIWGLYAEHTYASLLTNPLGFILFFAPTMLAYGVISMPAVMSIESGTRIIKPLPKYLLTFAVLFVCTILPLLLLLTLRESHPGFFPPRIFIP